MTRTRSQVNKKHKDSSSKSSRNVHKVSAIVKIKKPKTRTIKKGANAAPPAPARLQRNKTLIKKGTKAAPCVIMLFGLSSSVNIDSLENDILSLLSSEGTGAVFPAVASPKYKIRATVLKAPHGDLLTCMEMAKVADLIAFVASPKTLYKENASGHFIDSFGSQCLSAFRQLGLPSTTVLIRDLPADMKRKQELKNMCKSKTASTMPKDCKFHTADNKNELDQFMSLFKEQKLTMPDWRTQRSYVMAQKVDVVADEGNLGKCTLILTGYVRACRLSPNQLVHVTGAGDFQLAKIELLKDPCLLDSRKRGNFMDCEEMENAEVLTSLTPDSLKQDHLEQILLREAEMDEVDLSGYQDDSGIDYSDSKKENKDDMMTDDGETCRNQKLRTEDQGFQYLQDSDDETEKDSVMMDGENLTDEQIEEQIRKIKEAHADDKESPDEVDTPLDIAARKRFAKYRSLKSSRTSSWDPKDSLPPEYSRILAFDNSSRTKKHVSAKLDTEQDSDAAVEVGSYVRLYIKEVPECVASKLSVKKAAPLIASGLSQNESKVSVLHFCIKKHDTYTAPIKAKEELLFHVGFRQFVSRPIFSSDFGSELYKMERFLHPKLFCRASCYAPICLSSDPLIAFKSLGKDTPPVIAAAGYLQSVDPNRIILKRIILTGYPQRVSKLKATVRYMFHNPDDVRFFKPVEVETKGGRRGRIKESLGTHGAMKCIFNGGLQQHDTVLMRLYKRVHPKWPRKWFPLQDAIQE